MLESIQTEGWMDGWLDGWVDGWTDGWMGGWLIDYKYNSIIIEWNYQAT